MSKFLNLLILFLSFSLSQKIYSSQIDPETKKTHLEDIFIWKICDELKLSVQEEKKFTEINKLLNKKKSEINKKIQLTIQDLSKNPTESALNNYKKLIQDYNQLSISEFDSMRKLLGNNKFANYIKIKNELTSKIKTMLLNDKLSEEKIEINQKKLPPPKVIIEKND